MSSYAEGSVTVENGNFIYAGGLAGKYVGSAGTVSGAVDIGNCYTTDTADVTFFDIVTSGSQVYAGGLIGWAQDSTIKSCHAEGGITGEGSFHSFTSASVTVSSCYAEGSVDAEGSGVGRIPMPAELRGVCSTTSKNAMPREM
jgi:hypothetical protein